MLGLLGDMCMVGAAESVRGVGCQAAVAAPVTWFQVVNRSVIAWRCSWAESRCRPGRTCGEVPLKADKNRWACRAEVSSRTSPASAVRPPSQPKSRSRSSTSQHSGAVDGRWNRSGSGRARWRAPVVPVLSGYVSSIVLCRAGPVGVEVNYSTPVVLGQFALDLT